MAIITMSTAMVFGTFRVEHTPFQLDETSESTGASSARSLGPPRWGFALRSPDVAGMSDVQASIWQSTVLKLRGKTNHFALWDINRAAPRGTMRGTLTLSTAEAAGSTVLGITGGAGQASTTLLTGDLLQVGTGIASQLVMVVADATANGSGVISVTTEPPLRLGSSFAIGTAVAWDKPLCHTKMTSKKIGWDYMPGTNTRRGIALDLMESWT